MLLLSLPLPLSLPLLLPAVHDGCSLSFFA
jgi:hypothetical protein